jgi:putative FmdB family regulatory protein
MPTYDFRCLKCHKKFSRVMTISEFVRRRQPCPSCGSKKVEKQISGFFAITAKKS